MSPIQTFWHDPNWPGIESRRNHGSHACYRLHSHDAYSFGSVDAGKTVLALADGCHMALQAGDVLWLPPAWAHSCNPPKQQSWAYQMLYANTDTLPPACLQAASVLQTACVWRDARVYQDFCAFNHLLCSNGATSEKQQHWQHLLAQLPTPYWQHNRPVSPHQPNINSLLQDPDFLKLSIAQMAQRLHLSRFHFMRLFQASTGWTAHAYQLNCRIQQARQRLRDQDSLSHIAHDLGFADQSHFQRVFKAHTAATPKQYR